MGVIGSSSPRAAARGASRSPGEFPLAQGTYTATGVYISPGALDRWFAARNAAASRLSEVTMYGDSTWFGQTGASAPYYSPLQRIRERLIAAGYTDGGHGNLNGADDVTSAADTVALVGFAVPSDIYVLPGESNLSATGGDSMTFTRSGRYLTLLYARANNGGRFTYEIDGGGEIPVDPAYPTSSVYTFAHTPVIDMGTDSTHTIVVRNKGGRIVTVPNYTGGAATGSGTGGTLTAGTYDYAAAFVSPDGKIGPLGPTRTVTISTGQTYGLILAAQLEHAGTTTNLYRRPTGAGNFQLVGSAATSNGSPYSITDSGAAGTTAYAQDAGPVLNSNMPRVNVATIVTRAAGIVLHNFAARGAGSSIEATPYNLAVGLGLDMDPDTSVAGINRALDITSGARHPSLVILTAGINDQQHSSGDNSATVHDNTVIGIRAARRVGADALVTIPALEAATNSTNSPLYRAALKAAAQEEGAAWVDIGLGGALPTVTAGSTSNNPHLSQAQYQTQGDFIWDQVLGLV